MLSRVQHKNLVKVGFNLKIMVVICLSSIVCKSLW